MGSEREIRGFHFSTLNMPVMKIPEIEYPNNLSIFIGHLILGICFICILLVGTASIAGIILIIQKYSISISVPLTVVVTILSLGIIFGSFHFLISCYYIKDSIINNVYHLIRKAI